MIKQKCRKSRLWVQSLPLIPCYCSGRRAYGPSSELTKLGGCLFSPGKATLHIAKTCVCSSGQYFGFAHSTRVWNLTQKCMCVGDHSVMRVFCSGGMSLSMSCHVAKP